MSRSVFVFVLMLGLARAAHANPVARPEHDPGPGAPAGDIRAIPPLEGVAAPASKPPLRARAHPRRRHRTAMSDEARASRFDMESAVRHLNFILSSSQAAPAYRLPAEELPSDATATARADR